MPNAIARQDFATEAAHRLGIDSALVREELKQAAAGRRDQLPAHAQAGVSETEKVLLRALAAEPGSGAVRAGGGGARCCARALAGLAVAPALRALRGRAGGEALEAVEEPGARGQLARVLMAELRPLEPGRCVPRLSRCGTARWCGSKGRPARRSPRRSGAETWAGSRAGAAQAGARSGAARVLTAGRRAGGGRPREEAR